MRYHKMCSNVSVNFCEIIYWNSCVNYVSKSLLNLETAHICFLHIEEQNLFGRICKSPVFHIMYHTTESYTYICIHIECNIVYPGM